jgi:protein SCO1/2
VSARAVRPAPASGRARTAVGRRRAMVRAAAVALGAGVLAACDRVGGKPSFKATDVTGADYGRTLALTDHTGAPRTLADWKGKVVVLFFGFTQCPDVCPTTLATMADVMKRLGPAADEVQVLLVTLDPERDTPAVLAPYVGAFDPRFVALRGDPEATARAAREFKVFYQKVPGRTEKTYSIDHTAASYLLDREGRLRLYVRHQQTADDVAADIRALLAGA